jgi:carbamoyl-phosphate synthase large subunit
MASGCGINLPERMVKHMLQIPYETHSDYEAGRIMVRYTDETICDMNLFEKLTTFGES